MRFLTSLLAVAALVCGAALTTAHAQAADARLTVTRVIDASVDDVWGQIRQLDDLAEFSSLIASVDYTGDLGVGGKRVCTAPDGQGKYVESIVGFDDATRSYRYAVVEGVPVQGLVNGFKVVDLGYNKAMVVWTSTYESFVENPQMTEEQFVGFMQGAINEMLDNYAAAAKA